MENSTDQICRQITFNSKKGHKDQIIALQSKDQSSFFSFSDDLTARLWDIRTCTSIKMFSLDQTKDVNKIEEPSGGSIEWIEKHNTLICSTSNKVSK